MRSRRTRSSTIHRDREPSTTILVVDPDTVRRTGLAGALDVDGHRVLVAPDTAAAAEHLRAAVDLVVLGTDASDDDHLDLLVRLRTDPTLRPVPLLFVTPPDVADDVLRRFALDTRDHLSAPVDPDTLRRHVADRLARPAPTGDELAVDRDTGLVDTAALQRELSREHQRVARGAADGVVALLTFPEPALVGELGDAATRVLVRTAAARILTIARPLDVVGQLAPGELLLVMPDTAPSEAELRLDAMVRAVGDGPIIVHDEPHHLVVSAGYARLGDGRRPPDVVTRARAAAAHAVSRLDDRPHRWTSSMDTGLPAPVLAPWTARPHVRRWPLRGVLRTPVHLTVTTVIAIALPLLLLVALHTQGTDASWAVLGTGVASLLATAIGVLVSGRRARRGTPAADGPVVVEPPATAVIVAHLPDASATLLETIEAFRRVEPSDLQIVVAYHTPHPLPVEARLRQIGAADDRIEVIRVDGSTSLVQDVTAALSLATGTYVGIFTADQRPAPDAFRRAWRTLSQGSDIVLGHDLIRNGSTSRTARRVAVDHEAAMPSGASARGRGGAFPLAGGPNAYWRTELLHTVDLRGHDLGDDLGTTILIAEAGGIVEVDPRVVVHSLAPTTWRSWWNRHLHTDHRWHRGAMRLLRRTLRSRRLTARQKLHIARLVLWREVSPWTNLLVVPVVIHWIWTGAVVDRLAVLIAAVALFVIALGPTRTFVARWIGHRDVQHASWLLGHLVSSALLHAYTRDAITRLAQL
ncbi:MAG: glycosyltransferase, partial [Nitriliruptoraceae bacterium]